jgi:Osmosensitive K+ channel histidine kinase
VYLGAAPGTGKTFMMLEDGNYLLEHGIDVVIGYVEHHGRKETEAEIKNLEIIPRKKLNTEGLFLKNSMPRRLLRENLRLF